MSMYLLQAETEGTYREENGQVGVEAVLVDRVDDGGAGGDLLGRVLDEVVHDILGVRERLAVRLERGERPVRVLARTLYVSLQFYGENAVTVVVWHDTYDLEEVGVEVRALDEVDDLGLDGVVGVAELSTVCGMVCEKPGSREVLCCATYMASSGAAAQTEWPKV